MSDPHLSQGKRCSSDIAPRGQPAGTGGGGGSTVKSRASSATSSARCQPSWPGVQTKVSRVTSPRGSHPSERRLAERALGLGAVGDVPDVLGLGHGRRHRGGAGAGHRTPGALPSHLRAHCHADPGAEAGAHPRPGAARVGGCARHRLGGGELGVAAEVADDAHRGAPVQRLLDRGGQADVLDVELGHREAVFGQRRRDLGGDELAEVGGIGRHVEHRDPGGGDHPAELLHDDVADLERDLVLGELAVGADDLADEDAGVGHADGVGPKGAQPRRPELRVAQDDRVLGAPLEVGEAAGGDEVDLGLERRLEAVVPVLQRRQDRHVVGLEEVETRHEDVGELALVDEDRGLPLAHGQLGAVLDLVAVALEAPDHRVAGVVGPFDDVDELSRQ